jgi:nitrogen fixation protein FixH
MSNTPSFLSQDNKEALKNPWVLGWLGFVTLVFIVNVVFVVTAMKTSPGLVDEDYYDKGRDHERHVQDKLVAKSRLGWQINLNSALDEVKMGKPMAYHLNVVDKAGMPLAADEVMLMAYRPSDANADFSLPMAMTETGLYRAELVFPLKGHWELTATVKHQQDQLSLTQKINVAP